MRPHSVAYAITNSSSETYHFPRYAGLMDLFEAILRDLWREWVRLNPEEARNWALGEACDRWPRPNDDEARSVADGLLARCPLCVSAGEGGVPEIHVHMTGTDSPLEFDEVLLATLGGKREVW